MAFITDKIEYHEAPMCPQKRFSADWWKKGESFSYSETEPKVAVEARSSVETEFNELARTWYEEIGAESSLSKITSNINYLRIIALGKSVVPYILRNLQKQPAPWFIALRAITGELNIGKEYGGNFRKIADAWLEWGYQTGCL